MCQHKLEHKLSSSVQENIPMFIVLIEYSWDANLNYSSQLLLCLMNNLNKCGQRDFNAALANCKGLSNREFIISFVYPIINALERCF